MEELMKTDRPDWQSVMLYVSQIYKYFETWRAVGDPCIQKSPRHSSTRQILKPSTSIQIYQNWCQQFLDGLHGDRGTICLGVQWHLPFRGENSAENNLW